ncbi:hypothetical protein [Legionella fairfieldensis]|uniref:hypothetical protein n=1 Tax=Legionella fairfieldensis TaxID=45064 RepID=UPI0010419AB2|nr:hypothetical protein [Legionella fairfieldensis]
MDTQFSFPTLLRHIHDFMFNLDKVDIERITRTLKKLSEKHSEQRKSGLEDILTSFNSDSKFYTSNPDTIFGLLAKKEFGHICPKAGDMNKPHSPLFNQGLIIGLTATLSSFSISYRVDFDPIKKLHVNMCFTIDPDSSKEKKYFLTPMKLELSNPGRFFVKKIETDRHGKRLQNSSDVQLEIIKFKFFIKMTQQAILHHKHPDKKLFLKYCEEIGSHNDWRLYLKDQNERTDLLNKLIKKYTEERKNNSLAHMEAPVNDFDSERQSSESSEKWFH